MAEQKEEKQFVAAKMSAAIREAQYAVRGAIVARAGAIQSEINKDDKHKYKFSRVIFCNIGNPQAFCSPPVTFHRQVLACLMYPPLMQQANTGFTKDVIQRAQKLLNDTAHQSIGAYTNSKGLPCVRASVANYLKQRDGFDANPDHIFLTNGASDGIKYGLQCLIAKPSDGILIPIPQYPLYSATITLNKGTAVQYHLDEANDWNADLQSIEAAIVKARSENINVRGIVVINPGNPTGQCMNDKCVNGIIELAHKYNVVILADEVYQENIYYKDKYPFVSFRKCLLSSDKADKVELLSFHSVSKGIFGECGFRGGYFELINIDQSGLEMVTKLASISLCPNTVGQCMVELMVNPPKDGDESYKLFQTEYEAQYKSLQERAKILTEELNKIKGITCNTVYGAMYAFPNIGLSQSVVDNAKKKYNDESKAVDFIYCMELLENYGICVVPGSGFGQKDGTFHFRCTLLPPKEQIKYVVESLGKFHAEFTKRYSS
eukprot:CAMPEP_0197039832 /NCGR_PEP_ID=MMETSP1384-20130603/16598_1 /TAXON_ID=29189 /ORGANISM="Ammonia sp." /LENGTH=490 /DNA_ID=CAMNT_0042470489 /DNA_START=108 /DNA_END=1580 /DNA_ORIENTATION=-